MAYVTSESTLAQVQAAFRDNVTYDLENDTTAAKEFIAACRQLLERVPARAAHGGGGGDEEVETDLDRVQKLHDQAVDWLKGQGGVTTYKGSVRHSSFEEFRT